jgi:hypothetical protein
MGLIDVVKGLLGDAQQDKPQPSVAQITIISTGVTPTSESQSTQSPG